MRGIFGAELIYGERDPSLSFLPSIERHKQYCHSNAHIYSRSFFYTYITTFFLSFFHRPTLSICLSFSDTNTLTNCLSLKLTHLLVCHRYYAMGEFERWLNVIKNVKKLKSTVLFQRL